MDSIAHFKCSSIRDDTHYVHYGAIKSKIDDKAGYASGCGYFMKDKLLPGQPVSVSRFHPRSSAAPSSRPCAGQPDELCITRVGCIGLGVNDSMFYRHDNVTLVPLDY